MKTYRIEVVQTNVFYEEAESEEEARRIVTEDHPLYAIQSYGVHFNIEEQEE
tara:strand:- start:259 stop:414 length:156 start_codon:yes stop_codon:yes gene_type:complete